MSIALAEMYVQGVSTRKVKAIITQMCGTEVSSTQVSNATKMLDDEFAKWRERPIGEIIYLYLDARYEHVRMDGQVLDCALFTAIGITAEGKRQVLGVSVSYSENEVHWRNFLESLVKRGMYGVKLIISDAHSGLKAARKAVFPTCPWQRCQFHLQQNAQAYVPKKSMKKPVASDIRSIFNAPNLEEAKRLLRLIVKKYESSAAKLAEWLEANIHEALIVFSFPETHRTKLRTTNLIERLNKTIKKRTHIVGIFPNDKSCIRLVTAILIEINEDWLLEKKVYLSMTQEG
jgi:transposase-like protein